MYRRQQPDENPWVEDRVIAEVPKNEYADYRVSILKHTNGNQFISVREWTVRRDGSAIPTRSGLAIPIGVAGNVMAALSEALLEVAKK